MQEPATWRFLLCVNGSASALPSADCQYRLIGPPSSRPTSRRIIRPHRPAVAQRVRGATGDSRQHVPRPVVNPDSRAQPIPNLQRDSGAIGREACAVPIRRRRTQQLGLPVASHPVHGHLASIRRNIHERTVIETASARARQRVDDERFHHGADPDRTALRRVSRRARKQDGQRPGSGEMNRRDTRPCAHRRSSAGQPDSPRRSPARRCAL
jgi:hypothetical protein